MYVLIDLSKISLKTKLYNTKRNFLLILPLLALMKPVLMQYMNLSSPDGEDLDEKNPENSIMFDPAGGSPTKLFANDVVIKKPEGHYV